MSAVYEQKMKQLQDAALAPGGSLPVPVRSAILQRARRTAGAQGAAPGLDAWIGSLADEVVDRPAAADIEGCLAQGRSEDEIFEVVVAAAVGTALSRADAALSALRKKA